MVIVEDMSDFQFINPACIRALVVSIGHMERTAFQSYVDQLRRVKDVRLMDLTPNPGIFNPQAYPGGRLFYHFATHNDDTETLLLHDFEPFRKTFMVIGLLVYKHDLKVEELRNRLSELKKRYPSALSHFLFIFCEGKSTYDVDSDGIYVLKADFSNIRETFSSLSSIFLAEFSTYASAYEHVTLRSPGFLSGTDIKRRESLIEKQRHRISDSFELSAEKARKYKTKGRRLKIYANFYLLAGNLKQSLSSFCESIFFLKAASDYLWLASALDGLSVCIFLLAFLNAGFQLPSFVSNILNKNRDSSLSPFVSPTTSPRSSLQLPPSITNTSQISSAAQIAPLPLSTVQQFISKACLRSFMYYQKSEENGKDFLPFLVYCEARVRFLCLIIRIYDEHELNRSIIHNIVANIPISNITITNDNFDCSQLTEACSEIFSIRFKELSTFQQCDIYNQMILVYNALGLHRKKAMLINALARLLICSDFCKTHDAISVNSHLEMEAFDRQCLVYGINVNRTPSIIGSSNILQKRALLNVLVLSKQLKNTKGIMKYGTVLLKYFYDLLTNLQQIQIYDDIRKSMLSSEFEPEYWDQKLLCSISIQISEEAGDALIQNEIYEASITIKNPFAFPIEIKNIELFSDGEGTIETNINTKRKSTITSSNVLPIVVTRQSTLSIPLFVVIHSYGVISISGIRASVCGCRLQEFKVPKEKVFWKPLDKETEPTGLSRAEKRRSHLEAVMAESLRYKCKDTSAMAVLDSIPMMPPTEYKTWNFNVIHEQPLLRLAQTEVNNRWILLLEGECKRFEITLKNCSSMQINDMVSTFLDSTIEPLNELLSNKNLQSNETYEIEYYLIKKKPFKILNKPELVEVKGNSTFTLQMEIWGKRGVKEAKLILSYGCRTPKDIDDNASEKNHAISNFTRKITIPVNVTVYPSVELVGCDTIPLSSHTEVTNESSGGDCWPFLKRICSSGHKISDFCLLALDFLDSWTEEIEVHIQCLLRGSSDQSFQEQNGLLKGISDDTFETKIRLGSKKTTRILVPIERMKFSEEYLDRRIPSLRNKQFIYDSKTPKEEQKFTRRAFWLRNELLQRIRACWKIPNDIENSIYAGRSGTIDLRSIRFSSKMANMIAVSNMDIKLTLYDEEETKVICDNMQLSQFYTVRTQLINRGSHDVMGILRQIPVCKGSRLPLEKRIIINGVLQQSIGIPLKAYSSRTFDLGICFLEKGEYEWGAVFDEMQMIGETGKLNVVEQHLQKEQLRMKVT